MNRIDQKLSVPFEFPVIFTSHLFDPANRVLVDEIDRFTERVPHRTMVFVEEAVTRHHPGLTDEIARYFSAHPQQLAFAAPLQILSGGEAIKNDFRFIEKLATQMLDAHLSRHAYVVIIGGGATLDAVGFAASLVHRGLRQVRVPTTVLSQNDGGVGVKNGVNFAGQKNALGVFAPPFAVINDFEFLKSLGDRQWLDGIAEAFKVAIIRDKTFFGFLTQNAAKLRGRDPATMQHLVFRCAELHLEHIRTGGDPFEFGHARPLDFGHWSAHKLETMSGFKISHGEAVAIGILLDSLYAVGKGWLTRAEFDAIRAGFLASGLPVWLDELETPGRAGRLKIFGGIAEFQEHLGGKLCITFPQGIGARHEVHEIDLSAMAATIIALKTLAAGS
jgi:3-dehydroquinate synthase